MTLNNKKEIEYWLKKLKVKNYEIRDNLIVDVNGSVFLKGCGLEEIPFQFGTVRGTFDCSNNYLNSLKGAPVEVHRNFDCNTNHLTNLKGSPALIYGNFLAYNNDIESLEGGPKKVYGQYCVAENILTTLKGSPYFIGDGLDISNNNLSSIEYITENIKGRVYAEHNQDSLLDSLTLVDINKYDFIFETVNASSTKVSERFINHVQKLEKESLEKATINVIKNKTSNKARL